MYAQNTIFIIVAPLKVGNAHFIAYPNTPRRSRIRHCFLGLRIHILCVFFFQNMRLYTLKFLRLHFEPFALTPTTLSRAER